MIAAAALLSALAVIEGQQWPDRDCLSSAPGRPGSQRDEFQAPRAIKECAVASASGSPLVALRAARSALGSVAPF
jgi:hypothetical protein